MLSKLFITVEIEAFETLTKLMFGDLAWMFIVAVAALLFKDIVTRIVSGTLIFFGSELNEDDIVFINGSKKARIVRVGILSTTFFLIESNRKLRISNSRLSNLMLEKALPTNGNHYVDKTTNQNPD